ncbi:unnamed protein product [Auanema sp. JU1783]|nr:unnamed protein product [Auanema sp. JU1783]
MSILFHDNPGTSLGDVQLHNTTEEFIKSPEWFDDIFPNNTFIDSPTHSQIRSYCRDVLEYSDPWLGLRYWDWAILIPNITFLLFLLINLKCVLRKTRGSKSPVLKSFFILVYLTTIMNVVRCFISMTITVTNPFGEFVDKILWISIKFFYTTAELCVLTFALLFGQLDRSVSIRRVLFIILIISLLHTAFQIIIDMKLIDETIVDAHFFNLHTDGGLLFWILTSISFVLVYFFVLCLPLTCFRKLVNLPSRCSFYGYCIVLAFLNCLQAFGAVLLLFKAQDGFCFTNISTYIFFCFYTPIVYLTFLKRSLKHPASNPSGALFSYRKQKDESGSGELPDSYYPRFSGLTSPSYDDLFDCGREDRQDYEFSRDYLQYPYDTPLMVSETAESTVTTRTGSDDLEGRQRDSMLWNNSLERVPRQLKGLGANGTLVFEDNHRWR